MEVIDDKKLGPTGKFPQGKLESSDEGELRLAIGIQGGKLKIAFGTPVEWLALDKRTAQGLAMMILDFAEKL